MDKAIEYGHTYKCSPDKPCFVLKEKSGDIIKHTYNPTTSENWQECQFKDGMSGEEKDTIEDLNHSNYLIDNFAWFLVKVTESEEHSADDRFNAVMYFYLLRSSDMSMEEFYVYLSIHPDIADLFRLAITRESVIDSGDYSYACEYFGLQKFLYPRSPAIYDLGF